jgi:hypothetical protein
MNTGHLRRKVDWIESETGIDSAQLDELSVVEIMSYDIEPVDDDVVQVVQTGELRRCPNPNDLIGCLRGDYHD